SMYDAIMNFFLAVLTERDLVRSVYEPSIIALQPWVEEELRRRRQPGFGTLVFLSLCGMLWQPSGSDDPLGWPPVLLVLVKEQSPYLQALAQIVWLSWGVTHGQMRRVMTEWLTRIEIDERYRRFLLILLQAVIDYERARHRNRSRRGTIE